MWQNPHTLVLFDAKDEKGNVVHWAGEAASAGAIRLLGWSKYSLRPEDYRLAAESPSGRGFADNVAIHRLQQVRAG